MAKKPDSRPPTSMAEANLRRMVEQSPLARALASEDVALPAAKAPSLEGLEVTVPRAPDLTEEALLERFHALRREQAEHRQRAVGEKVAEGDEVVVDIHGQLERVARELGMEPGEVKQALKEDREAARKVAETALHLHAVEYVMNRARIHFEGAEEGRAQLGKR